ncbi:MAG: proline racemase family protein [Verrucomicrobiota bacterium]
MKPSSPQRISVVDSHTAGEPTRVILPGFIEPSGETMMEKRETFARELDWLRTAAVCEPRGHDAVVGALLCKPANKTCVTGIIFFNNVGMLNGCLHGTMGVAATLLHMGRIGPGEWPFDTPTGVVTVSITDTGRITVQNVRSYRSQSQVPVEIAGHEALSGDIAWGGNWFFLVEAPPSLPLHASNIEQLTHAAWQVREQLTSKNITGNDGGEIDHIEFFGPPEDLSLADSKNFVLCPGKAYDRSPCGTGTSAKLACLHASGDLEEGSLWRQAGILNTVFEGSITIAREGGVYPTVSGSAYVTAEADLIIDPSKPFAYGIPTNLF